MEKARKEDPRGSECPDLAEQLRKQRRLTLETDASEAKAREEVRDDPVASDGSRYGEGKPGAAPVLISTVGREGGSAEEGNAPPATRETRGGNRARETASR